MVRRAGGEGKADGTGDAERGSMTIVLVLLALSLARFALVAGLAALLIRRVRACPACGAETLPLRRRWLEIVAPRYEWRWCPHCRWQGPARRA